MHPYPSLLDGAVTVAIASVAGAGAPLALWLGGAMVCLQFAIGALNDLADARGDALSQPSKPLPAGLVRRPVARAVTIACAAAGIAASAVAGPGVLLVALVGLGDGILYDLRLKGSPFGWLPFAVGVGLLPVFAWIGGSGMLPATFVAVFLLALLAGTALALANAAADLERDIASGRASIATAMGLPAAVGANAVLLGVVQALAVGSAIVAGAPRDAWFVAQLVGAAVQWLGFLLTSRRGHAARELGWEVQAAGLGVMAAAWLAAMVAAGALVPGRS